MIQIIITIIILFVIFYAISVIKNNLNNNIEHDVLPTIDNNTMDNSLSVKDSYKNIDIDKNNNNVDKFTTIKNNTSNDNIKMVIFIAIWCGACNSYKNNIHNKLSEELKKIYGNIKFEFIIKKGNKEFSLYMEDQRRFSKIQVHTETLHNKIISELGIDIFSEEFTERKFKGIIKSKNLLLVAFLLNQHIFCGIGNYIKNESLYLSHIKVKVKTSDLTDEQISKLYSNILFVAYSILIEMLQDSKAEKYLSTDKKFNKPDKLDIPYQYRIYSLEKTIKGEPVNKIKVGGRDTYAVKWQL